METVKLGSLYFNGSLVSSGAKSYQGIISIGETVPRMALTWNVVGGRLVANQTVCNNISWNQLCEGTDMSTAIRFRLTGSSTCAGASE